MKKKVLLYTIFTLLLTALPGTALAAQTTDPGTELGLIMTVSLLVFVVATLMYIIGVMGANVDPIVDAYLRVKHYVIPQPTEEVHDMGHDFDGIRELDNRIPPWFNYLFGVTVIFAIVYMIDYHVVGISPLMEAEYNEELATAALHRQILLANEPLLDENTLVTLKDDAALKVGVENFQKYCISCHGPQGGGIVGPNLTDQYWIQGGGVKNIYQTIKKGVPAKGMISWELVFTQRQIHQLASYVMSMQGTNPPGGKAPEGQLYVEPAAVAKDTVNQPPL